MAFFSLVVSTKGRSRELIPLLESLRAQTWQDFDLVAVDQNDQPLLAELLAQEWGFPILHLHCPGERGLSRGRNVGWRRSQSEFVLFPDDDCWYRPDFLAYAAQRLAQTRADVLTGRAVDEEGRSINGRFELHPQKVSRDKVWTTQIEWVAFFRRRLLEELGGYDVDVGVGASTPWQACEGQDIVLRGLEVGANCQYDPALSGRHAEIRIDRPDAAVNRKGRAYARGMGYVLRKHGSGWAQRGYWIARPFLRSLARLLRGDRAGARYYRQVALGRFEGASGRLLQSQTAG